MIKKNKYRNYVPLKLATIDIHPDVKKIIDDKQKERINIKIVYAQEILNQYEYIGSDRIMGVGQLIRRPFNPKCIIFIPQNYYPEFKKIIDNIKDFKYFS